MTESDVAVNLSPRSSFRTSRPMGPRSRQPSSSLAPLSSDSSVTQSSDLAQSRSPTRTSYSTTLTAYNSSPGPSSPIASIGGSPLEIGNKMLPIICDRTSQDDAESRSNGPKPDSDSTISTDTAAFLEPTHSFLPPHHKSTSPPGSPLTPLSPACTTTPEPVVTSPLPLLPPTATVEPTAPIRYTSLPPTLLSAPSPPPIVTSESSSSVITASQSVFHPPPPHVDQEPSLSISSTARPSLTPPPFIGVTPLNSQHTGSVSPSNLSPISRPIARSPTLPPPPKVSFDSEAVKWKGLPLEAALWTFDSAELQSIVSRAIRSSAQESFIRLVSIDNLDKALPAELDRLDALKAVTQSKYRFNTHRRTMLLQALLSFSGAGTGKEKDGGTSLVGTVASQLSDISAECDSLAEQLVRITDQIGQIRKLVDVHWGSALAIALRKLNGSYGKRTRDLLDARARITQLEAELEDSWKEAEKLARELDELDDHDIDFDEDTVVIRRAQIVSLPRSPPVTVMNIPPLSPTPSPPAPKTPNILFFQKPLPVKAIPEDVIPEEITEEAEVETMTKGDDRASIRSAKSARIRIADHTRVEMISAARRRSLRASMGSLRLPRSLSLRSNKSSRHPPLPAIPKEYSSTSSSNPNALPVPFPDATPTRRTSIEDIEIVARVPEEIRHATTDDMCIMPLRDNEDDHASRKKLARRSIDNVTLAGASIYGQDSKSGTSIPSIWLNADTPQTPAERVESLMTTHTESQKGTSYMKLKSLTKRYSLPFPTVIARTFSGKSSNSG
ncbi:hypothetical protein EDD18DRAFT_1431767 [Armillaria luteobubalina]|uniref:Uncharacterized protein n=1 Tax=Armillaria luteobubalina TaxID=153913 RepID=A0AA39QF02_9AGAR|nr:hypothetical protein EDD18DRAFT_1431767 [Armillaria luteobubalina]